MKIKKYVVREMQEAMRLIKEDMGPDAVIISSYRLPRKSIFDFFRPPQLEVTAALDELPSPPPPAGALPAGMPPRPGRLYAPGLPEQSRGEAVPLANCPSAAPLFLPPGVRRTRREGAAYPAWKALPTAGREQPGSVTGIDNGRFPAEGPSPKGGREQALPAGEEISTCTGPKKEENCPFSFNIILKQQEEEMEEMMDGDALKIWRQRLLDMEVEEDLVKELLRDLAVDGENGVVEPQEFLRVQLKGRVAALVEEPYSLPAGARVQAFIGPTGVGKTTILAKLATRLTLFEQKKIALVVVYSHRFGMVEELKFYAENIGLPVEVVMTPAELAAAVQAHQDKDAVLIDTEGISSRNVSQLLKLKGFMDALPGSREIFLVLSATTRNRDLSRMARDFSRVGFSRLIFTKLDETETRGAALNLIHQTRCPVAYVTTGQNVPDDIAVITPRRLAAIILEESQDRVGPGV